MDKYLAISTNYAGGIMSLIIAYISALLAYLAIDTEILGLYIALMCLDLFTGVLAAFIRHEVVAKRIFLAGLATKILLLSIPIVIAMLVKINAGEFEWLNKFVIIVLSITETISILNNYLRVKGEPLLPEVSAVQLIASKLRSLLLKLFSTAELSNKIDLDKYDLTKPTAPKDIDDA